MQPNSIAKAGFGFSRKKAPEPVYGSGVIEPPARHSPGDGGWVWEDAFGAGGAPRGAQALLARGEATWANAPHVSGGVPVVGSAIADEDETVFVSYFLGNTLLTLPGEAATTVAKGKRATTGFSYLTTALGVNVDEDTDSASPRFIRLRSGGATPDRQGKPYDADLQAHVFPYRNYATALGRWTSADPLGFPDGPNRHFYAPVPTMGLDPLGLSTIDGMEWRWSTTPVYVLIGPWEEVSQSPSPTIGGQWDDWDNNPNDEERLMNLDMEADQERRYYREYRGYGWNIAEVATGAIVSVGVAASTAGAGTAAQLALSALARGGTTVAWSVTTNDFGWSTNGDPQDYTAQNSIDNPNYVDRAETVMTEWEVREL
ncbi:MAG: RHS repeat-associated core domain-containing protein [Opitutales bacterium]